MTKWDGSTPLLFQNKYSYVQLLARSTTFVCQFQHCAQKLLPLRVFFNHDIQRSMHTADLHQRRQTLARCNGQRKCYLTPPPSPHILTSTCALSHCDVRIAVNLRSYAHKESPLCTRTSVLNRNLRAGKSLLSSGATTATSEKTYALPFCMVPFSKTATGMEYLYVRMPCLHSEGCCKRISTFTGP